MDLLPWSSLCSGIGSTVPLAAADNSKAWRGQGTDCRSSVGRGGGEQMGSDSAQHSLKTLCGQG